MTKLRASGYCCRALKGNSERCAGPAMKGEEYCSYHIHRNPVPSPGPRELFTTGFTCKAMVSNGKKQCGGPALTGHDYCRWHTTLTGVEKAKRKKRPVLRLPSESELASKLSLNEVLVNLVRKNPEMLESHPEIVLNFPELLDDFEDVIINVIKKNPEVLQNNPEIVILKPGLAAKILE